MHKKFLLAALKQAELGRGLCAPNPSVGAVAVQNGVIIAQAWHKGSGTPHAEPLLLAQLPPKMPGVSLYITLEPCNHWGKTPPCVDAIISYGVERVFFAYLDPNPVVAQNNSSALLRQHGIHAEHTPLQAIDEFYKSYTYWTLKRKPFVTIKMAQTLDGVIGQTRGERLILSNSLCAQFTHQQRASSDVLLTTARTVHRDNPQMNVRLLDKEQMKPVAIIDSHLSLNKNARIFSTARHCHIYHDSAVTPHFEEFYPNSSYYPIPLIKGLMDLNAVLCHLGGLGYHDLWVEAGGALFSALHQQGLVNRTYLYLVPSILGQNKGLVYQQGGLFERAHTISWRAMGDNMIACFDWVEDSLS